MTIDWIHNSIWSFFPRFATAFVCHGFVFLTAAAVFSFGRGGGIIGSTDAQFTHEIVSQCASVAPDALDLGQV